MGIDDTSMQKRDSPSALPSPFSPATSLHHIHPPPPLQFTAPSNLDGGTLPLHIATAIGRLHGDVQIGAGDDALGDLGGEGGRVSAMAASLPGAVVCGSGRWG